MKVSVVTTVKDARDHVGEFLGSLATQTRPPDEIVVVDGGSTDGTLEVLRSAEGITLLEEPGANISRGRNVAIRAASHDVIAVTDADCVLEPDWLENILGPIEAGADIAMGFYRPITDGFLQACVAAVNLPDADDVDPDRFMPSGRSVAYTREAIDAAGGYPEWLEIGEDMYVDHRWRELGLDMRFAPDAIVRWHLRSSLTETWTQYFRYARGDAIAGMYPERNAIRFATYSGAMLAWSSKRRLPKLFAIAAGGAYAARPIRRATARLQDPAERARAILVVPALMAFIDIAKMAGYGSGLLARSRRA